MRLDQEIAMIPGIEPPKMPGNTLLEKIIKDASNAPQYTDNEMYAEAREDFLKFAIMVDNFPVAPIHIERDEFIRNNERCLLIGPQGHGKTTLEAILRPIWLLGRNPNERIKIVTISDSKARDILAGISDRIETPNEELQQIFPGLQPSRKGPWSAHKLNVVRQQHMRDVSIEAVGILSSPTGGRATVLIFDDILDFNNTIKAPTLEKLVRRAFWNMYIPLLEPHGRVVVIGTPWRDDDLIADLKQKGGKWKCLEQKIPDDFEPLWPAVWTKETLLDRYEDMREQQFNRAYRCVPLIRRGSRADLIDMPDITPYGRCPGVHFIEATSRCVTRVAGVDPGTGKKSASAYPAIVVLGIDEEREPEYYYLLDVRRDKFDQVAFVEQLVDVWRQWSPDIFFVESNGIQASLIEWLQLVANEGLLDIPDVAELVFEPLHTGSEKWSMEIGLPAFARIFQQGRFLYPKFREHPASCDCGYCLWEKEIGDPKNISTSDIRMATWMAWKGHRLWTAEQTVGTF